MATQKFSVDRSEVASVSRCRFRSFTEPGEALPRVRIFGNGKDVFVVDVDDACWTMLMMLLVMMFDGFALLTTMFQTKRKFQTKSVSSSANPTCQHRQQFRPASGGRGKFPRFRNQINISARGRSRETLSSMDTHQV